MPFSYITDTIDKTKCIGNALSTININFTALDVALSSLSAYTVASVNFLSATIQSVSATLDNRIQFLSATVDSVSANLQTQINFVSSNVVSDYLTQGIVYQEPDGDIFWDMDTQGVNARLELSANAHGFLHNPFGNLFAGQNGHLSIQLSTSGYYITGIGGTWKFPGNITNLSSLMVSSLSSYNLITYYYNGSVLLGNVRSY